MLAGATEAGIGMGRTVVNWPVVDWSIVSFRGHGLPSDIFEDRVYSRKLGRGRQHFGSVLFIRCCSKGQVVPESVSRVRC